MLTSQVRRIKGSLLTDGAGAQSDRQGPYGEQYVLNPFHDKKVLADEGSYFSFSSGPGTFVAQQGQIVAFGDTTPLWVIANPATAKKPLFMDFLRLMLGGTAPATTVSLELAVRIDSKDKTPTNANQYTNPAAQQINSLGEAFGGTVYAYLAAQAMATPASSAAVRNVARGHITTGGAVVGDQFRFNFGGVDAPIAPGLTAARGAVPTGLADVCNPVIIQPGEWATVHLWWLTSTTNLASWEWEMGLVQR